MAEIHTLKKDNKTIYPKTVTSAVFDETEQKFQADINKSKQPKLVSGENIKTINGQSILGEGDLQISSLNIREVVVTTREDDTLGYNGLNDVDENDYIVKIISHAENRPNDIEICIGTRTNYYVDGILSYYTISWWSGGIIHYTYVKYTEESPDISVAGREFFVKRTYVQTTE